MPKSSFFAWSPGRSSALFTSHISLPQGKRGLTGALGSGTIYFLYFSLSSFLSLLSLRLCLLSNFLADAAAAAAAAAAVETPSASVSAYTLYSSEST
ncbi:hypothetical protein BZA05DRAFT_405868 [Tricharina praecox]|uniref:uncharacterized protein n=1 Tax=Tricharina praecox TaxID=43433 RepID=UPI00221E66E8|nr:uncharacterized protein BZA05DRAFT_405868 [Tricharina praecox]KAI5846920.1 hypothetical protein BZA05DRAFT_405868 [Tricharina praecox]